MKPLQRKHIFLQPEVNQAFIDSMMYIRDGYSKITSDELLTRWQIPIDVDKRPELYKSLGEVRTVKPDKEYTFTEISDNLTNQINKYHGNSTTGNIHSLHISDSICSSAGNSEGDNNK